MSTNYYMLTKNKKFADTYFPEEYELYRGGDVFKAEIHIGKSSAGWMPLFREHKHAYDSVEKLRDFLREYADDIEIIDEYHNISLLRNWIRNSFIGKNSRKNTRIEKTGSMSQGVYRMKFLVAEDI